MNPQEQPTQRREDELGASNEVMLRKIELLFYLIFPTLAVVCFVLPPVYHLRYEALYVTAVLSILYSVGIYFIRFKLSAQYSILLHIGLILVFSSSIIFSFGRISDGLTSVIVGSLIIAISLGISAVKKCERRNSAIIARNEEAHDRPYQPLEAEGNNPDLLHGHINNLNLVLANGPINPINEDLANNQVIPNGHAVQPRDFPPVQVEEPNEQAFQPVEEPNRQAIQQVDEPGAAADGQRENLNEQIDPEQQG